ncbi:MAG: hypothetical protein K1X94_35365 [Sandaracinaceae bacterium]|nr:hypothetical protein [Sandaracinaceae bacterium]
MPLDTRAATPIGLAFRAALTAAWASEAVVLAGCPSPEPAIDASELDASVLDDDASVDAALDAPLPPCEAHAIDVVAGRVTDLSGSAVPSARPQLCARLHPDARLVCLSPPFTDERGDFRITVPPDVRCMDEAVLRVLVTRGPYAVTYCPLDLAPSSDGTLSLAAPIELAEIASAPTLPAAGDPASRREVDLGPVVIEISPTEAGGVAEYMRLGALAIDPARSCVPEARALAGLVAITPEQSRLELPFRIASTGLTAGTSVDLFVIGGLDTRLADGSTVPEGELATFGRGVVGADGTIEPAVPLPQLGWLGWSPAR